MQKSDNKKIARNTLFLYLRMGVSIIINLYTLRVVWRVLGIDDYGIYNLVGGIVLMFQFLNSAMVVSSQRFISYELGRGGENLRKVFSISVTVHTLLALLILLLGETAGLWFLNSELNIPTGRMVAANWVYQFSMLAFIINVTSVPYTASIVAHEDMKAYGYIGIADMLMRLGIVFLLMVLPGDKLIIYAILTAGVQLIVRLIYQLFCRRHYKECRFKRHSDRGLIREMFVFAGWSFIGNMGFSVRDQGLNIIINQFFNVAMNAAKGVAFQVANVVRNFSINFQMALNPQITMLYARGEKMEMLKLVGRGCKFSLMLMALITFPLYFRAEYVLTIWLTKIDSYMVGFLKLSLMVVMLESLAPPIVTAIQATGKIKRFQIWISILMVANLPLAWIWLKFDLNPYAVMWITLITSALGIWLRVMMLREQIEFSEARFCREAFLPLLLPTIASYFACYGLNILFPSTFPGLVGMALASVTATGIFYFFGAFTQGERKSTISMVFKRIKRT